MPTVDSAGVELYYETAGDAAAPAVVFVGDAGLGAWQWGWQQPAVAGRFRTLVFDHRGVGRSGGTDAAQSVPALVADLRAVVRAADVGRPHLVGGGLGGLVALEYAREHGARSLALLGATPGGAHPRSALSAPADGARTGGCAPPDDADALRDSLGALLSADFRAEQPAVVDGVVEWRADDDAPAAVCERQFDALVAHAATDLYEVGYPTLVLHGEADAVVPVADGRLLADSLPRGEFAGFEGVGHLVGVERSRPVNDRLVAFLERQADP